MNVLCEDVHGEYGILVGNIISEAIKNHFRITTGAKDTSITFKASNFLSKDWFKHFKKHFYLHNVKLIPKEVSMEYMTESKSLLMQGAQRQT